jgi:O-antigen ligase
MSIFWAENQIAALQTFISLSLTFIFSLFFFSCLLKASPNLITKTYTMIKIAGIIFISLLIAKIYVDIFILNSSQYSELSADTSRIKPIGSIIGLMSFVCCAFLWMQGNKLLSIFIFSLLFCLVSLSLCKTALYALIAGSTIFVFSYLMPFWATRIGIIASYTFSLLMPLFFTYVLSPSMILESSYLKKLINVSLFHRWLAWEYYSKKFFEKPFVGWGAESSRFIQTDGLLAPGYISVLHPHNNSIQAYSELGLFGGVLYALFFSSLFYLVEKHVKDRLSVAVCNATLTFGFVSAQITHNAWRNYWLSLAALTAGLIILFIKAREAQQRVSADHLGQPLAL